MKRLLVIFIDAFRYDYLSQERTPFLYSINKNGFCTPLKPILGYTDAIKATIFTGVYPEDHGYWMMYKYSPETSPFKIFKHLRLIDHFPSNLIVRGLKFVLSATVCKLLAKAHGYSELSTHNIPFSVIDSFDYTLQKSMLSQGAFDNFPTLFDTLRENGIGYSYIDCSKLSLTARFGSSVRAKKKLSKTLTKMDQDVQLAFIYLHQLDNFAHRYGISSARFSAELTNVDGLIKSVVDKVRKTWGEDFPVMIFSDHGMAETTEFVSFDHLLRDKGFGKDFLFCSDSTMIRLWYLDPEKKQEVRKKFDDLGYGAFLSEEEKKELKINFNHRYYGDDIYLLDSGYSIFPNFFSWLKPQAMHAYHPDDETQQGIFILIGEDLNKEGAVRPVDVALIILDLLGLETPSHYKDRSLIKLGREAKYDTTKREMAKGEDYNSAVLPT